jgi:hypothetical protein
MTLPDLRCVAGIPVEPFTPRNDVDPAHSGCILQWYTEARCRDSGSGCRSAGANLGERYMHYQCVSLTLGSDSDPDSTSNSTQVVIDVIDRGDLP